ncbi:MAG: hypothetical protein WBD20_06980 [Pirellulaceae bacterium]
MQQNIAPNVKTLPTKSVQDNSAVGSTLSPQVKPQSLADLMAEICQDAGTETAHYLLRSNTSHDGE